MSKKLEILKNSLEKKQEVFNQRLDNHFSTVAQANGQPLNDKRNGQATLNKWERQRGAIRTAEEGIEKTKQAIEREEGKIRQVEYVKEFLPQEILDLIESGVLIQWRKYPHICFVNGVDKARIIWDNKKKQVSHKFASEIKDKDKLREFAKVFNPLSAALNKKQS